MRTASVLAWAAAALVAAPGWAFASDQAGTPAWSPVAGAASDSPGEGADTTLPLSFVRTPAEARSPFGSHRLMLGANLGLGSAVGVLGVTCSFIPISNLESEFGVGLGISGVQVSALQRFSLGSHDTVRFVTGAGISVGSGGRGDFPTPSLWLNLDLVGMQVRAANGFVFYLAGGATMAIAGKHQDQYYDYCEKSPCYIRHSISGFWYPQGRMGFGYWF